jgi:hypothetical protein
MLSKDIAFIDSEANYYKSEIELLSFLIKYNDYIDISENQIFFTNS